tara:strand:- start:77 stop:682 length:606 start_codon:yes stop_codon:yes gene_type:complete
MPRKKGAKVDCSNTVIYKLSSNNPLIKDGYVGKSVDFPKRKANHKSDCNNEKGPVYNTPVYVFIRENGGYDNWEFEILETANLEDEKEVAILERYWIETLKPTLNERLPILTPEERAEYKREYDRIRHKKKMEDPEYRKKRTEITKNWRKDNPETAAAARANKQKIKIICVCGAEFCKEGKPRHLTSVKHKKFVENNPQEA